MGSEWSSASHHVSDGHDEIQQPITKTKDSAFGNDEAVAITVAAELGFAITSIAELKLLMVLAP